jgi:carboxymethylenebutenolidase
MPDDPAIIASEVQITAADETLIGYLARPAGETAAPVILVCHENRGLTPHIQDVTRRFAKAGYVSLAVDLLSRQGGSAALGEGNVPGALGNIAPDQFVEDFKSGWRYLQEQAFADAERVGMTGFCFGGGVTWRVATQMPELLAAVPFYGPQPPVEDVPNIRAAVLAIYGELDSRINSGIPAIEAAMTANNKIYEKVIYPNADHAFHNDTGSRYNPEAAKDAWERTLAWFEQYVRNA